MSLNYEMSRYTELTGEDGTKVSVSRLGGYLDGYEKGRKEAEQEHAKMCESCIHKVSKEDIDAIRTDAIDEITEKYFDAIEDILHQTDLKLGINQALSIYARIMNRFYEIAEQYKEQNK